MDTSRILRIGEILVKKQFCTPEQIKHALKIQQQSQTKKIGTILVELAYVTSSQLAKALEEQWKNSFTLKPARKK